LKRQDAEIVNKVRQEGLSETPGVPGDLAVQNLSISVLDPTLAVHKE
jgi:hypothetical protein